MKKFLCLVWVCSALIATISVQAEKLLVIPTPDSSLIDKSATSLKGFLIEAPASLNSFVTPRIVGGTTAGRNDYPEFVQLYVDGIEIGGDPGTVYPICGASLISSNKVLTAAHCTVDFSASNLYVLPEFYSFNDDISFNDLILVSSKSVHSNYAYADTGSDVSVLTLSVNATSAQASIYAGTNSLLGFTSTVIGTGLLSDGGSSPSTLQKVNVPIISNAVCASSYVSSGITIDGTMLCAGLASGGLDSCQGDSGGPLWVTYEGKKAQAGIVSFGIGCAQPVFYGVYARTSALISFIKLHAPAVKIVKSQTPVIAPVLSILLD